MRRCKEVPDTPWDCLFADQARGGARGSMGRQSYDSPMECRVRSHSTGTRHLTLDITPISHVLHLLTEMAWMFLVKQPEETPAPWSTVSRKAQWSGCLIDFLKNSQVGPPGHCMTYQVYR